jgi:hypothetical protein
MAVVQKAVHVVVEVPQPGEGGGVDEPVPERRQHQDEDHVAAEHDGEDGTQLERLASS